MAVFVWDPIGVRIHLESESELPWTMIRLAFMGVCLLGSAIAPDPATFLSVAVVAIFATRTQAINGRQLTAH
jgi:hypothetical protein